eukprot:gnl/MRDRNA2_/MRDRNA2_212630_c0_seq1.p1 gnl/MRDRNA2_/MRDRNA2_212630_c0~~gnl/MRDRNA2_/MRDRNA2_212630_c0_seq1.p1  ORF type:complete len:206 (+),score=36.02 gnl/MRDRNA2_/MRDRNA2_212630_c0_seq1:39-620(+)
MGPFLTGAEQRATSYASPASEIIEKPGVQEMTLDEGPLGLHGIFGPVGVIMGKAYTWAKPGAPFCRLAGLVLFVLIFILSGVNKAKNFSGTRSMMAGFGLPCPTFFAIMGLVFLLGGSALILGGSVYGKASLVEMGAECLLIFLIFATYYGHYKPYLSGENQFSHYLNCLKNLSMMGTCLFLIGHEIPKVPGA